MSARTLLLALIPLSWLLPNHYYPWPSAWQDGMAMALLFCAALFVRRPVPVTVPGLWVLATALTIASAALQWSTGLIAFGGDALMVALYVGAFVIALGMGGSLSDGRHPPGKVDAETIAAGCVLAALVSVGIGLIQWTGSHSLGIWVADLPPGGRPFANVAQPNHLCTLAFLGLCSLAFLREAGRTGTVGFWLGSCLLLAGMVASGSRTGWLQAGLLLVLALAFQNRLGSRVRAGHLALLTIMYAAGTWAWPLLNDTAQLSGGRAVTQQIEGGVRVPLWWALLDAVWREPWWGYGWQQVAAAQQAVALDHPPINRHFEHSHNIVLDLLIWAGIPVGGLIVAAATTALVWQGRALREARALWLYAAVLGLLVHGMLELPLEYAYFLIPLGLTLGVANALCRAGPQVQFSPLLLRCSGGAGLALLAAIGADYLEAEQNHRLLRLESAHIGTTRIESKAPELRLLTQLQAFLEFARTEARPGMATGEIERMRLVSQRHGFPPVMLRYALVAGLNGQPKEAERTLARLCSIHSPQRCTEAREAWAALQLRYPVLRQVAPP